MTTLAAIAGLTSPIRLGLLVAGVTYRHPSIFANQALTIDHASQGRLELSLGAAWYEKEHTELGIPFPSTGRPVRPPGGHPRDPPAAVHRRGRVLRGQAGVVARAPRCARCPVQARTRRSGSAAPARSAPCRWSPATPTCGTRGARRRPWPRPTPASTTWPPRPAATRRPSCGRRRCRSTTSTPPAGTPPSGRTPAPATSCAAGPSAGRLAQVEASFAFLRSRSVPRLIFEHAPPSLHPATDRGVRPLDNPAAPLYGFAKGEASSAAARAPDPTSAAQCVPPVRIPCHPHTEPPVAPSDSIRPDDHRILRNSLGSRPARRRLAGAAAPPAMVPAKLRR